MKRITLSVLAAGAALAAFAAPAQSAVLPSNGNCSVSDIGIGVSNTAAISCIGFFSGNALNSSEIDTMNWALDQLGSDLVLANVTSVSKNAGLGGASYVDFSTFSPAAPAVTGLTIVGLHWGGSIGTAFYAFDAGAGITGFNILKSSNKSSNVLLFSTGGAVPEPASWAMMITGFGVVGGAMRRKKAVAAFA